jgi:hypothetical protein
MSSERERERGFACERDGKVSCDTQGGVERRMAEVMRGRRWLYSAGSGSVSLSDVWMGMICSDGNRDGGWASYVLRAEQCKLLLS